MKSIILMTGVMTLALLGAAWAGGLVVVDQKGLAFNQAALTVAKGTIVQFTNSDNTPHNILIAQGDETIDGGLQQPGATYKVPFLVSGEYEVTCAIHPKMHMSIKVP